MANILTQAGQSSLQKNGRGTFIKEMYFNQEQATIKEQLNEQHRKDLLQQIEEKRLKKEEEKRQQEQEDMMYMEKIKKQQQELNVSRREPENDRKISKLHSQKLNESMDQPRYQQTYPNLLRQDTDQEYYNYTKIGVPQNVLPAPQDIQEIDILKEKLQDIIQRQQQPIQTFAQSKVDYDVMKQYYNYQQNMFDRDMDQLRNQLTKTDQGRLAAERELLYLQDRARERALWNLIDYESDAKMPNLASEQKSIFRTAKYAYGNMSDAERRKRILQDYYKLDREALALGPLIDMKQNDPEYNSKLLDAKTQHVKGRSQNPNEKELQSTKITIFSNDQKLKDEVLQIKDHDQIILTHINKQAQGPHITEKDQLKKMFEDNSLVPVMSAMKLKGDTKVMTPLLADHQLMDLQDPKVLRRLQTSGKDTVVTFTNDLPKPKTPQEKAQTPQEKVQTPQEPYNEVEQELPDANDDSSYYENAVPLDKTEDLLDPLQGHNVPHIKFDWELEVLEKPESEIDPLDIQISGVLDNIKTIVERKQPPENYYQVQNQLRVQQIAEAVKNPPQDKKPNNPHFKGFKFASSKSQVIQTTVTNQVQIHPKTPTKIQDHDTDPIDRLDVLLTNYNK